jgi:uncharacterized protein
MGIFHLNKKLTLLLISISSFLSFSVFAEQATISIIIDDIGYRHQDDLMSLTLPGPVAYAILPHAPHTGKMAQLAALRKKEILLHQPMQAMEKNEYLGPGALTLNMTREEFLQTLNINMSKVPNLIGINNHMGSLLTRHPGHMQWLMETIRANGQFYVDSLTSDDSVASRLAKENKIPYLTRDVFLDNKLDKKYIRGQFMELIRVAKRKGSALGIGHPHPATTAVLSEVLKDVEKYGVKFVNLKSLIKKRTNGKQVAQGPDTASTGL